MLLRIIGRDNFRLVPLSPRGIALDFIAVCVVVKLRNVVFNKRLSEKVCMMYVAFDFTFVHVFFHACFDVSRFVMIDVDCCICLS